MNHYDGPAFFRKYRVPKKPTVTSPLQSKPVLQSKLTDAKSKPAIASQKVERAPKSDRKVMRPKKSQSKTATVHDWKDNLPFRPTMLPNQVKTAQRTAQSIDYDRLFDRYFNKRQEDYLLLTTIDANEPVTPNEVDKRPMTFETGEEGTGNEVQPVREESVTFEPEPQNEDLTSVQSQTVKTSTAPLEDETIASGQHQQPTAETKDQTAYESEQSDVSLVKPESGQSEIKVTDHVASDELVSQLEVQSEATDSLGIMHAEESENEKVAEPTPEPTPEPTLNTTHGLGHSLGDILNEENSSNEQSELALFHDKPVAETTHEGPASAGYHFPSTDLLTPPVVPDENELDEWIEHQGEVLDETLQAFHVDAHVVDWTIGPTVTQFQVHLALGVKVNKITNLTDDLKLALAAKDIRIEAPIPGKTTVGIEIPNPKTRPVMLSEVLESSAFKNSQSPLTVALGVDLFGQPKVTDLRKMPHGLIAGATGSGKSVFINSLLISLLYKATPAELRLLLIDPKAVELAPYDGLPHLLSPVISDPKAAAAALKWAVTEMDERYERLAAAGVRNIEQYNERAELTEDYGLKLPYIVIVIDELADLMMMASSEVQDYIVRITQKARAAGIHLLIATQRPSVDIVTGTIKNNIPTRVAFMVSSQVDSRTIIDTAGAERLLGRGDMLFLGNGASQPVRLQGTYVDDEVDRITDYVRTQGQPHYAFDPDGLLEKQQVQNNQDDLLPEVLDYIVQEKTVSTSKLQRVFSIGYNRSANLIDTLENKQYISGQNGSKPRDVFLTEKQLAELRAPRTD